MYRRSFNIKCRWQFLTLIQHNLDYIVRQVNHPIQYNLDFVVRQVNRFRSQAGESSASSTTSSAAPSTSLQTSVHESYEPLELSISLVVVSESSTAYMEPIRHSWYLPTIPNRPTTPDRPLQSTISEITQTDRSKSITNTPPPAKSTRSSSPLSLLWV